MSWAKSIVEDIWQQCTRTPVSSSDNSLRKSLTIVLIVGFLLLEGRSRLILRLLPTVSDSSTIKPQTNSVSESLGDKLPRRAASLVNLPTKRCKRYLSVLLTFVDEYSTTICRNSRQQAGDSTQCESRSYTIGDPEVTEALRTRTAVAKQFNDWCDQWRSLCYRRTCVNTHIR